MRRKRFVASVMQYIFFKRVESYDKNGRHSVSFVGIPFCHFRSVKVDGRIMERSAICVATKTMDFLNREFSESVIRGKVSANCFPKTCDLTLDCSPCYLWDE